MGRSEHGSFSATRYFVSAGCVPVLVALNAFFVAAEFALVGARRTRLEQLAAAGNSTAALGRRIKRSRPLAAAAAAARHNPGEPGAGLIGT
ncbi:MAG: CNNM domain-containing protein [Kouleothrix sp.]